MNIATTVMDEIDIEAEDGGSGVHPMFSDVPRSVSFNKLRKRLLRQVRLVSGLWVWPLVAPSWVQIAVRRT